MIRIELSQRIRRARRPRALPGQPQIRSRLLARLDAGVDEDAERLRLLQQIDGVVADPGEFEIGRVKMIGEHAVEHAFHPGLQRRQAFLQRLLAQVLRGRAVDLIDEGRGGNREGVTDDAREPFVILILQRRLARLDKLEVARHELDHAPVRRIAAHQRVEIILELADLIDRPFLRQGGETVGRRAGAIVVQRRSLAAQRDIDGERDLLHRAHAIEPVRARIAREIDQLVGGEIGGGHAVQHLLIGGLGRLGRAPVLADQRLDRGAVDDEYILESRSPRDVEGLLAGERTNTNSIGALRSITSEVHLNRRTFIYAFAALHNSSLSFQCKVEIWLPVPEPYIRGVPFEPFDEFARAGERRLPVSGVSFRPIVDEGRRYDRAAWRRHPYIHPQDANLGPRQERYNFQRIRPAPSVFIVRRKGSIYKHFGQHLRYRTHVWSLYGFSMMSPRSSYPHVDVNPILLD